MYKVVYGFIDVVENRNYNAGDPFVVGPKTDDKRIGLLSGYDNNLGRPLIEKVDETREPIEDEHVEETQEPIIDDKVDLELLTIADLKVLADERELEYKARSTKAELIALIKGE